MNIKGILYILDIDMPQWLSEERLHRFLPSYEPITYAALRARIYLVSADLIDHILPAKERCLPESLPEKARKSLRIYIIE